MSQHPDPLKLPFKTFDTRAVRASLRRRAQLRRMDQRPFELKKWELLAKYGYPEHVLAFLDQAIAAAANDAQKVEQCLLFKHYLLECDALHPLPLPDPEQLAAPPEPCILNAASAYVKETYSAPAQVPVFAAMLQLETPFDPVIWELAERSTKEPGTLEPNGSAGFIQRLPLRTSPPAFTGSQ